MRMLVVLTLLCVGLVSNARAELKVGEQAPEINARVWINTEAITLANSTKKIVVLEFWSTFCKPCVTLIPQLNQIHAKYKDKGVILLGLTNEPPGLIKSFVSDNKIDFCIGAGSLSAKEYEVKSLPQAFVVAPGGKIVWQGSPEKDFENAIEATLKATPSQL